jgi:hypothetical protein
MSNKVYDYAELIESGEKLVPLSEACEFFRPPVSKPTIIRHYSFGIRGEILRTVKVGGIRCTTVSEIKRFMLAQLENPAPPDNEPRNNVPKRSTKKTGGGMTPNEISEGLKRHKLES